MQSTKVRDSVNRVQEIVVLPAAGIRTNRSLHPGDIIELAEAEEAPIDCAVRDAMDMADPVNGDAVGDAVFDAGLDVVDGIVFDANTAEVTFLIAESDGIPLVAEDGVTQLISEV